MLTRAYARLGPRYPSVVITIVPQLAIFNVLLGVVAVALDAHMSPGEFARILAVAVVGMFLYNLVWMRVARGLLEPLQPWLAGRRDHSSTLTAWQTCASLPREMMRRDYFSPLLGGLSYLGLACTAR